MGYRSIKVKDQVYDEIKKQKEKTGLSSSDIIGLGLPLLNEKCRKCGKTWADHAFIFDHIFQR